jgi:hypothetical protein
MVATANRRLAERSDAAQASPQYTTTNAQTMDPVHSSSSLALLMFCVAISSMRGGRLRRGESGTHTRCRFGCEPLVFRSLRENMMQFSKLCTNRHSASIDMYPVSERAKPL